MKIEYFKFKANLFYTISPLPESAIDANIIFKNNKLVSNSKKGQSVHTLVFVLLQFHVFCKLYLISHYTKFLG